MLPPIIAWACCVPVEATEPASPPSCCIAELPLLIASAAPISPISCAAPPRVGDAGGRIRRYAFSSLRKLLTSAAPGESTAAATGAGSRLPAGTTAPALGLGLGLGLGA